MSTSTDDSDQDRTLDSILEGMDLKITKFQNSITPDPEIRKKAILEFESQFQLENKTFEEIIANNVFSEIAQDYDTIKIYLNNWIVKIKDDNSYNDESTTIEYDARLHYMDDEYITGNSLYNSLYKLHNNDQEQAIFDTTTPLSSYNPIQVAVPYCKRGPTHVVARYMSSDEEAVRLPPSQHPEQGARPGHGRERLGDSRAPYTEGGSVTTSNSDESFGEEFMPESYYEKQKSELIIEYLVFLSEKSFYLFRQTCTIFIRVILKVLKEIMKISLSGIGMLLRAALGALFQFIFQNYLDPIYELLKNLNPFKIPFEKPFENNKEYEYKINNEINDLKEKIEKIKNDYGSKFEDIQNAQNAIKSREDQNNYFWIADQLLKAATGPILLAIQHHVREGLIAGDARAAILGN